MDWYFLFSDFIPGHHGFKWSCFGIFIFQKEGYTFMRKIGIDAGGTLVKVVYQERGERHYKTFLSSETDSLSQWIRWLSPNSQFCVTGGKAARVKTQIENAVEIPEFKAVCSGAASLLYEEHKKKEPFILANIGTGTSLFFVNPIKDQQRRLAGTGMGGGTIMGLGRLLSGQYTFSDIIQSAESGDRENVDLLVKDLYENEKPPIPGHLTAANFAGNFTDELIPADALRSLINMVAENIILLSSREAEAAGTKTIVFSGGALKGNPLLVKDLGQFQDILNYDPVFLKHGAFAGAMGCLL
ncbi:type II pantothenate kinase [Rossellomorea vietnamensis]|uniref:Type II pantothenate kinase n=2 Tax=Rossellomorea vietnamensis TaxID=218284 RepID=A0A5D4KJC7_9BACI|nr:type II pantothenate kinase [Rossellomorea vietnamensis]